jgi:hypothetical protein
MKFRVLYRENMIENLFEVFPFVVTELYTLIGLQRSVKIRQVVTLTHMLKKVNHLIAKYLQIKLLQQALIFIQKKTAQSRTVFQGKDACVVFSRINYLRIIQNFCLIAIIFRDKHIKLNNESDMNNFSRNNYFLICLCKYFLGPRI